jgi:hypothetical protein
MLEISFLCKAFLAGATAARLLMPSACMMRFEPHVRAESSYGAMGSATNHPPTLFRVSEVDAVAGVGAGANQDSLSGAQSKGITLATDFPSLQAAIDSIPSGTVFAPAGTYALASALRLKGAVHLVGAGRNATILDFTGNTPGILFFSAGPGPISMAGVRDLTIRNSFGGGLQNPAILLDYGSNLCDIQNVRIEKVGGSATTLADGVVIQRGSSQNTISDISVDSYNTAVFLWGQAHLNTVNRLQGTNLQAGGLLIDADSSRNNVSDVVVEGPKTAVAGGVYVSEGSSENILTGLRTAGFKSGIWLDWGQSRVMPTGNVISNFSIRQSGGAGLNVETSRGNVFSTGTVEGDGADGISVYLVEDTQFRAIISRYNRYSGAFIENSRGIILEGDFYGNGASSGSGIRIANSEDVTVNGRAHHNVEDGLITNGTNRHLLIQGQFFSNDFRDSGSHVGIRFGGDDRDVVLGPFLAYSTNSGPSILLDDGDSAWTPSPHVEAATDAVDKQQGKSSAKLAVAPEFVNGIIARSPNMPALSLTGCIELTLWFKIDTDIWTSSVGQPGLQLVLSNSPDLGSLDKLLEMPQVPIGIWVPLHLSLGDASSLTGVRSVGFRISSTGEAPADVVGFTMRVDDIGCKKAQVGGRVGTPVNLTVTNKD